MQRNTLKQKKIRPVANKHIRSLYLIGRENRLDVDRLHVPAFGTRVSLF